MEGGSWPGGLSSCLGPGERAQQLIPLLHRGAPRSEGRAPDPQPQLSERGLPGPSPLSSFELSQPLGVWKDILGIWKICKSI